MIKEKIKAECNDIIVIFVLVIEVENYHRRHSAVNGMGCAGMNAPLTANLPVILSN